MTNFDPLLLRTRRHFFRDCGVGLGAMALGSLLARDAAATDGGDQPRRSPGPLAPKKPHFEPKAKRVIFLFLVGGPSQLDLFDPKPALEKWHGKTLLLAYTAWFTHDQRPCRLPWALVKRLRRSEATGGGFLLIAASVVYAACLWSLRRLRSGRSDD